MLARLIFPMTPRPRVLQQSLITEQGKSVAKVTCVLNWKGSGPELESQSDPMPRPLALPSLVPGMSAISHWQTKRVTPTGKEVPTGWRKSVGTS